MSPENRRQHIESVINTLQSEALSHSTVPSEFDKARLFANVGLLVHDGLTESAKATQDLTQSLTQASRDLQAASAASGNAARRLNQLTFVLAFGTVLLVGTGIYQGCETKRQADIAERQIQSTPPTPPPSASRPAPNPNTHGK